MKYLIYLLLILPVYGVMSGCGSASHALLHSDKDFKPEDINFKSIAIVPNQLPLNLPDGETWRKYNWTIINKKLTDSGYIVLDFATSATLFEDIGLPLVDTKASKDNYAELAIETGADLLIIPYYATGFRTRGVTDRTEYLVNGSLWFYLPTAHEFIARVDFDGSSYYHAMIKLGIPLTLGLAFGGTFLADEYGLNSNAGLALGLIPALYSGIMSVTKSSERRYKDAFERSINDAVDQFLKKYK